MADQIDAAFIRQVNENLGIAHKVSRTYCAEATYREDLLQEMLYQLWKSYLQFDGRSKFSTWMYRVCLNTALTHNRKTRNDKDEPLKKKHLEISDQDSGATEENNLLFRAIEKLSDINKAIIILYLDSLSYDEIAAITGLTKSNVSVRLVRIKKELESYLKKFH